MDYPGRTLVPVETDPALGNPSDKLKPGETGTNTMQKESARTHTPNQTRLAWKGRVQMESTMYHAEDMLDLRQIYINL